MPLVRLLLPIVAALALLVQPVTAYAAAGVQGDTACCCPDPHKCDCHDHPGERHDGPRVKRCGSGPIDLVAPVLLVAIAPAPAPALAAPHTTVPPSFALSAPAVRRADRPEKPPG